MKRFSVRKNSLCREVMPRYDLWIIMTLRADLCNIQRIPAFMKPCRYVIIKLIDKIIFFMTYPAPSERGLGDAVADFFKERQRSEQGVVVAILTRWHILSKLLFVAFIVRRAVNTLCQEKVGIFV